MWVSAAQQTRSNMGDSARREAKLGTVCFTECQLMREQTRVCKTPWRSNEYCCRQYCALCVRRTYYIRPIESLLRTWHVSRRQSMQLSMFGTQTCFRQAVRLHAYKAGSRASFSKVINTNLRVQDTRSCPIPAAVLKTNKRKFIQRFIVVVDSIIYIQTIYWLYTHTHTCLLYTSRCV